MAQVDRSAYVTATITLPGQQIQSATEWITDKSLDVNNVSLQIAPGSLAIVEIHNHR